MWFFQHAHHFSTLTRFHTKWSMTTAVSKIDWTNFFMWHAYCLPLPDFFLIWQRYATYRMRTIAIDLFWFGICVCDSEREGRVNVAYLESFLDQLIEVLFYGFSNSYSMVFTVVFYAMVVHHAIMRKKSGFGINEPIEFWWYESMS